MKKVKGKAVSAVDLVRYQKDTVVSTEIIQKKQGTVTVFAFDKGQGLSEHTAPFDALVEIIDGSAQVFISRKPHTVKTGQMIIMPAHKPHSLFAKERFKMMLVLVRA